ncbi:MAG: hypothetical protein K9J30_08860 [Bacteroidales bacterium]|nr:hypothetical protein [Bacteroidales bacterium]
MDVKRSFETILTISVGFCVLYLITGKEHEWMLYATAGTGIGGLFWKLFRHSVHRFWFWLADQVGFVVSRFLLSIIFILIVIPFGLVSRIFRKDLMFLKGGRNSYYVERDHTYKAADLENPW